MMISRLSDLWFKSVFWSEFQKLIVTRKRFCVGVYKCRELPILLAAVDSWSHQFGPLHQMAEVRDASKRLHSFHQDASSPNLKIRTLFDDCFLFFHRADVGHGRSFVEGGGKVVQTFGRSDSVNFDAAVIKVPGVAGQVEGSRMVASEVAESHALHDSADVPTFGFLAFCSHDLFSLVTD
jgi:hypothetical protein